MLGDNERVRVGDATPEQWRLHDKIEEANFKAQEKARKKFPRKREAPQVAV